MSEERKEELIKIFATVSNEKKKLAMRLIDEVVFLEEQIEEVKKHPLYRTSPNGNIYPLDNLRVYKELSNQYNMDIKTLGGFLKSNETGSTSPLGEWLKGNYKDNEV